MNDRAPILAKPSAQLIRGHHTSRSVEKALAKPDPVRIFERLVARIRARDECTRTEALCRAGRAPDRVRGLPGSGLAKTCAPPIRHAASSALWLAADAMPSPADRPLLTQCGLWPAATLLVDGSSLSRPCVCPRGQGDRKSRRAGLVLCRVDVNAQCGRADLTSSPDERTLRVA